jgi:LacI family transcriptional regulator
VICSPSHPSIAVALRKLHSQGLPIVQTVSKTIEEADYVGIDNYAVGRTAGLMLSRLGALKGTVVAMCHSQIYQVHRDRIRGFSDYMDENPQPGLTFQSVLFGLDSRETSVDVLLEALEQWPDLAGFYNSGGGNVGLLKYMERLERSIFFVGHELTPATHSAIESGTANVIFDQMPEAQARRSIDLLFWKIGLLEEPVDNPPIRFVTVTTENL